MPNPGQWGDRGLWVPTSLEHGNTNPKGLCPVPPPASLLTCRYSDTPAKLPCCSLVLWKLGGLKLRGCREPVEAFLPLMQYLLGPLAEISVQGRSPG